MQIINELVQKDARIKPFTPSGSDSEVTKAELAKYRESFSDGYDERTQELAATATPEQVREAYDRTVDMQNEYDKSGLQLQYAQGCVFSIMKAQHELDIEEYKATHTKAQVRAWTPKNTWQAKCEKLQDSLDRFPSRSEVDKRIRVSRLMEHLPKLDELGEPWNMESFGVWARTGSSLNNEQKAKITLLDDMNKAAKKKNPKARNKPATKSILRKIDLSSDQLKEAGAKPSRVANKLAQEQAEQAVAKGEPIPEPTPEPVQAVALSLVDTVIECESLIDAVTQADDKTPVFEESELDRFEVFIANMRTRAGNLRTARATAVRKAQARAAKKASKPVAKPA